jgi:hypothetical protein
MQLGGEADAADAQTGQQKQHPIRPAPAEPDTLLPREGIVQVAFATFALHKDLAVVNMHLATDKHLH